VTLTPEQIEACRRQFPALSRRVGGERAAFFDAPGGTQVPRCVIDAVAGYLAGSNANRGGLFATSRESDALLDRAHRAMAELLGSDDPDTIAFGPNMTTLTFALSRSLARTWRPGDEIVVTRLDHDANVTPWVLAAEDAGARARFVDLRPADCSLDLDDLRSKLGERTRLVAVAGASNATGTVNPVSDICRWAHDAGSLVFLDAVHWAPHELIDVDEFGCDFLACSAYKFFGPHVGALWGRRELLEELGAYKLRPAPDSLPGKWMTGTQNHEGIAGVTAAIDYLADLGRAWTQDLGLERRDALREAFVRIRAYERRLTDRLLDGLSTLEEIRVWGVTDAALHRQRFPTVAITHSGERASRIAARLGEHGIFVWHGNYYALQLTEALGLEPEGMLRIGLVHYNTEQEVDRLLTRLQEVPRP
jgi:cysteine desulfurase family protein (TIGR01976 family)